MPILSFNTTQKHSDETYRCGIRLKKYLFNFFCDFNVANDLFDDGTCSYSY